MKNQGEVGKELSTQPSGNLRAAQGDGQSGLAGRELDAAVAERVMNLHPANVWHVFTKGGYCEVSDDCPEYSTVIAAAMEVVEKMQSDNFSFQCSRWGTACEWGVAFSNIDAMAEVLPEAICRAALAAVAHNAPANGGTTTQE